MTERTSSIVRSRSAGDGIWVRSLAKRYGDTLAVSEVNLSVLPGTCLGLLGPNGAGKTTTLLMLAGVITPDAGSIAYGTEKDPARSKVRRLLGFVPQSIALYQDLSAHENLSLFARLHGVGAKQVDNRVRWG